MDDTDKENASPHIRRKRYSGSHPKSFAEKYKELSPEKYDQDVERVKERGQTPAGMHRSICVQEILEILHPCAGEIGLDATLGYGGHARELLARIQPKGRLFACDVDPLELPKTEARLRDLGYPEESLCIKKQNFAGILKLAKQTEGGFDFVLADLGVSSMQIDNPERGFSYKVDGPLDLRLNPTRGQSAADLLATLDEAKLEKILRQNSDEPYAKYLAKALCAQRGKVLTSTHMAKIIQDFLDSIVSADPEKETKKTMQRCFQALRIEVNDEFGALDEILRCLPLSIKPGARIAILTFHSGEDTRVVRAFEEGYEKGIYSSYSKEPVRASAQERFDNPRSKSARLRWAIGV